MQLASTVNLLLEKFLVGWFEDFKQDDINLSLLQGQVTVCNLKVKSTLLDDFNLPFKIAQGYVGKIEIKIPWNITGESVIVHLSNIFVLVNSVEVNSHVDLKELMAKEFIAKMAQLDLVKNLCVFRFELYH
eukprot:TRINITY_DN4406_c0_g1_i2.p1 TRINITY_DN4406_c0_g1~~TRINITY_DN4406_c0_g1_i2.p1  ORF type:complete len:131 (-),score=21.40 TRINITY_DN4406_c0_g1_i2:121-513(-)